MGQPRPLFLYFRSFQTQILQKKLYGSACFEIESSDTTLLFLLRRDPTLTAESNRYSKANVEITIKFR